MNRDMTHPHAFFIGRTTVDAVYRLDRLPQEDTKAFAEAFRAAPGGPACNAALTHAMLGGSATLISAVGDGPLATVVRERLGTLRVRLIDAAAAGYVMPLTTVLVASETGTRTIINPPAAQGRVNLPVVWNEEWGTLPEVALTDGFHLRESLPLLRALGAAGVPIFLDGGSWKEGAEALAPLLTGAICSERFAVPGRDGSPQSTLDWFAEKGVPFAAITRGGRPIAMQENGRRFEIPVRPIEVVDTLGAGDVLHGAFCLYAARGEPSEDALRHAAEIATRSCEEFGIDHLAARNQSA
jgi:sugar/nucleoside kinase (ribokinase family)